MVSPGLVGTIQLLTGVGALAFLKPAFENREKPGSDGFRIFTIAVAAYALATGANLLTSNYAVSVALVQAVVASGVLTGAAWLFFSLEMADEITVTRRRLWVFVAYVLVAWLVTWLNPGNVVIGPGSELVGTQLDPDYQLGFWLFLGLGYVQILLGTGVFAIESLNSTGIRRRQTGLLAVAIVPAVAASVVNAAAQAGGTLPYDYTVFGWLGTLIFFAVALYSGRFLDISALARRAAVGDMHDAMVTLDDQQRIVDCNAAARDLLPIGEDYVGTPAEDCLDVVEPNPLSELSDAATSEQEVVIRTGDTERYFSVSNTPITDTAGRGCVLVFHDVTAQKRRELQLARQNERLEKFSEVVSHDLRNPLEVASGYVELAEETGDPEHFDTVRDAHQRIESLVEDMLTLARAGQTVDETQPVNVHEAARQAWTTVDTGGCTFGLEIPDDLTIQADYDRLLQVLENLFRNAVEHNDRPVTIRLGALATDSGTGGLFVEDDGRGLPDGGTESIFEHGFTTEDDGTGFGLSIVEDIVEAHGWSIRVTGAETGGARFEVTGVELVA